MKIHLLAIIFILTSTLNLTAKEYVHISAKDGLQSDYITSLHRDTKGFVWIGTTEGLSRFDGISTKRYNLLNAEGKPSRGQIRDIVELKEGEVIISSDKELYKYNRASDSFDFVMQTNHTLYCALQAKGYYFAGGDLGLVTKNIESGEVLTFLKRERIVAICEVEEDIYILTPENLYILYISNTANGGAFEFVALQHAEDYTLSAMEAEDGALYIGTRQRGVYSFDTKTKSYEQIQNLPITRVRALHVKNNMIYVNQDNFGVVCYDIKQQRVALSVGQKDNHPMTSMSIYCVHADSQGLLWVGSFSNGVYLVQPKNSSISVLPQSENISIRSMWHISDNRFIIGSREGLYLYDNGITKHFTQEKYKEMGSNIILSIRPFKGDKYIVGTFKGGAFILDEATQRVEPLGMGEELTKLLCDNSVYSIEQVGDNLYFFTLTGLVRYSAEGEATKWDEQNSTLPSSLLFSHFYDKRRNTIWMSTKRGFCKFNISTESIEVVELISEGSKTPIVNDFRSNMITMDGDDNILLDRDNIALLRYNPETKEVGHINFAYNATGHISGVIQDEASGNMWIATTNDIYAYNEDNSQYVKIMESRGFPSTNVCPNSILKTASGHAYVGTELGLYTFHTQANDVDNQEFHIFMSSITTNGADVLSNIFKGSHPDKGGQIIYNINISNTDILQIDVVAPHFAKANNYKYAFRIDNKEWIYTESNRLKLSGRVLPFGSHELYVMVTPRDNMAWSEPIYVGRIRVMPNMVMILSGVILMMILSGVVYIVIRRAIKNRSAQESTTKATTTLDDRRADEVIKIIKETLSSNFRYRNPTYRIKDLSDETGIPTIEISQVLNNYFRVNFADFINDYRIEEMKELLLRSDVEQYNLHILSEQCGFNSKASFYRIFKNKTGFTPMQYRKQFASSTSAAPNKDTEN